jgi:hypothetical protein
MAALARMPQQLDIVNDTGLAAGTRGVLSTSEPGQTPGYLSTKPAAGTRGVLSTMDVDAARKLSREVMKKLDGRRAAQNITIHQLCTAARIHPESYRSLRRGVAIARPKTMQRLQVALKRLAAGGQLDEPRTLCLALIRLATVQVARGIGVDPHLMLAQDFSQERPTDRVWLQASRIRRCAVYLLVEGLDIGKAEIGAATGASRQAVHKTVMALEAERERDGEFDALMRALMLQLTGEAK